MTISCETEKELLKIIKGGKQDEEDLFCASLVPALKRMTARNRSRAKCEILQIIDKYEFLFEQPTQHSPLKEIPHHDYSFFNSLHSR